MNAASLHALAAFLDTLSSGGAATTRATAAAAARAPLAASATAATPASAGATPASAQPSLSGLAQLVARLAAAPGASPLSPVALPLPTTGAPTLSEAIREAVQSSGLFYESHLEDWALGKRELASLQQEPQARYAMRTGLAPAAPDTAAANLASPPSAEAATRGEEREQAPAVAAAESRASAKADAEAIALPRALEPIVREQLSVLAQGAASVPLVPWRGQQATLEIRDEAHAQDADAAQACRLALKMTLPGLGRVEFVLAAQGDAIRIAASAGDAGCRAALAAHAPALQQALEARALRLEALEVSRDDA